jgi:DNA (cytosine-5)-methyltransferase 1
MLQLDAGRGMEYVVGQLEQLEYRWAYRIIDSRAFGLPQRRERVYLVASKCEDPRRVLFRGNEEPLRDERVLNGVACGFYWTEGTKGLGWAVDAIPTLKGGSTVGIPSPPAILLPTGELVMPEIRDAERLQGFRADWTKPAESIARKGIRWKLVGNAVTVHVAEWIGRRLLDLSGETDLAGYPLQRGQPWPRAAWYDGSHRFSAYYSTWPVSRRAQPLGKFLKYPQSPLSVKATAGFLARAQASSLKFPEGFLAAVAAHLRHMKPQVA